MGNSQTIGAHHQGVEIIKEYWEEVLFILDSYISNAIFQGFNTLIWAAKARACGYRKNRNIITMAYLIAGNLDYDLPI
jgi:transposase